MGRGDHHSRGALLQLEVAIVCSTVSWTNARRAAGVFFASGIFLLGAALGGCAILIPQTTALHEAKPAGLPERVELREVPFFPQKDYQCGPAALAMALVYAGAAVTPDELVSQVYLPARKGSLQVEMLAAARRYARVSYQLAPRFEDLLREVAAGNPVIVLQDYGVWPISLWHYVVVVGYDYPRGEAIVRSGEKERLVMPFGVLEYLWKESDYWAMVTVPPDRIPATAKETEYLAAVIAMERLGNARADATAYATFLERWPDNLTAAIGLANAQYSQGELKAAESVLRQAAGRHPDSVVVLNNLAQTLSDLGNNEEALRLIERAQQLPGAYAEAIAQTRGQIVERMNSAVVSPGR